MPYSQELEKEVFTLVDECIKKNNFRMKASSIAIYVITNYKGSNRLPSTPTLQKWIKDYCFKIGYYSSDINSIIKKEESKGYVVYGLVAGGQIRYVGKTTRGLDIRKEELIKQVNIQKIIQNYPDYQFITLYKGETDFEIQTMEKNLIALLNPEGNIDGRTQSYTYDFKTSDKDKEIASLKDSLEVLKSMILCNFAPEEKRLNFYSFVDELVLAHAEVARTPYFDSEQYNKYLTYLKEQKNIENLITKYI